MTNLFKITGTVTLKKGAGRQLKSGGMWVYDNEIDTFSETVEDGGLIDLHDHFYSHILFHAKLCHTVLDSFFKWGIDINIETVGIVF